MNLITHSPFTRTVNLAETLRLTGIAYVEGRPVATFLNKETKQSVTVSSEPNAQGWVLTDASRSSELRDSEVTLQVGEEEVTLHFGDEQLSPGAARKGVPTTHLASIGKSAPHRGDDARSSGEEKVRASSYLGEDGKALYASLSSDARSKFKDLVKARIEKQPDMTQEQRAAYAQKIFTSLKSSDENGGKSKKTTGKTQRAR